MQPARAFAQGIPETCCLDKLASARGKACAVSKPLFAVLSLLWHNSAVYLPDQKMLPGILTLDFDLDADCCTASAELELSKGFLRF